MARRPDKREAEILSEDNLREIRHNLAHLSLPAVRDFYEQAYRDCRLVYNNLPSPRQIQTLVQVPKANRHSPMARSMGIYPGPLYLPAKG